MEPASVGAALAARKEKQQTNKIADTRCSPAWLRTHEEMGPEERFDLLGSLLVSLNIGGEPDIKVMKNRGGNFKFE
jgi:hypothetical protein